MESLYTVDDGTYSIILNKQINNLIPRSRRNEDCRYEPIQRNMIVACIGTRGFKQALVDAALKVIQKTDHKLYEEITGIACLPSKKERDRIAKEQWELENRGALLEIEVLSSDIVNGLDDSCVVVAVRTVGFPAEPKRYFEIPKCIYETLRSPYGFVITRDSNYHEVQIDWT